MIEVTATEVEMIILRAGNGRGVSESLHEAAIVAIQERCDVTLVHNVNEYYVKYDDLMGPIFKQDEGFTS